MKNTIPFPRLFSISLILLFFIQINYAQVNPQQYYYLQARHSGKYIQLAKDSKDYGIALIQGDRTENAHQQFQFIPTDNGFYKILIRNSRQAVDVMQSSYSDGAIILQWPYNGTPNQQFALEAAGSGFYFLRARHSGKYLDIENVSHQNGAPLIQWQKNGGFNQQFQLIPVPAKPESPSLPPTVSLYQEELKNITDQIIRGVQKVAAPGVPGPLILSDQRAFPVVVAENKNQIQQAVVAAAYYGQGKVVAFGHDGFFAKTDLQFGQTQLLINNAIRWAARGQNSPIRIGISGPRHLIDLFNKEYGFQASPIGQKDWQNHLQNFDAVCVWSANLGTLQIKQLQSFVRQGGGLLAADLGWGWQSLNPSKDLYHDNSSNKLMRPMGIAWAPYYAPDPAEGYSIVESVSLLNNTKIALQALNELRGNMEPEDQKQALFTLGQAGGFGIMSQEIDDFILSEKNQPDFPGPDFPATIPPGTPRTSANITVQAQKFGAKQATWHSTGLYAAPGDIITLRVDPKIINKGLKVQIGAHSDQLWGKDKWDRFPSIIRSMPINQVEVKLSNPFGGLIYITSPANLSLGDCQFSFYKIIRAPSFELGKNNLSEWNNSIRYLPAPWAELISDKIILTIPSEKLKQVDNPIQLMQFWDKVLDLTADLAVQSRSRARPERIVPDKQISAGYMHSGYPIMTHLDAIDRMLSIEQLQTAWGLYHELGHNHQHPDWTFNGTVEVTCNLFTLYVREKATNITPRMAFMDRGRRPGPEVFYDEQKRIPASQKFIKWKADPFLALAMYVQLQEAFGWEAYLKVFKEYKQLSSSERPKNDDEKRDQWMVRFSKIIGYNLGTFFDEWGVPVSAEAKRDIAHLPVWLP